MQCQDLVAGVLAARDSAILSSTSTLDVEASEVPGLEQLCNTTKDHRKRCIEPIE